MTTGICTTELDRSEGSHMRDVPAGLPRADRALPFEPPRPAFAGLLRDISEFFNSPTGLTGKAKCLRGLARNPLPKLY